MKPRFRSILGRILPGGNSAEPVTNGPPSRRGSGWLLLLVSVLLGSASAYFSREYIETRIQNYQSKLDAQHQVTEVSAQVVVPSMPLYTGDVLVAESLSVRDVPEQYVDANALTVDNYQSALGRRLGFDVDAGVPLLWAHLAGGRTPTFSGSVPTGLRALTIRVDEINSVSGFLQPADRIDLLLSYTHGLQSGTVLLIADLEVLATGAQTSVDVSSEHQLRQFSTITVQVSPTDAQRLTLAQAIGSVTAVLRNPEDGAAFEYAAITQHDLLDLSSNNIQAAPEPAPAPLPRKRPRPPSKPGIQYIVGGS